MRMSTEFAKLKSVEVAVEERRVALEVTPNTWRTHIFTGLDTVPRKLAPAFGDGGNGHDLDLVELVRKSYAQGKREAHFEAPYRDGNSPKSPTVLRTVQIKLQYRREARAGMAAPRSTVGVSLPMAHDGLWPNFEIRRAEEEVARRFSKISRSVVALVVRLAKLDLRPTAGRNRLVRQAIALIERPAA